MAAIPGSVRVTGFIAPSDSADTYPAHEDIYGKGGLMSVNNTTERDAIPEARQKVGMLVYSIADSKYYQCTVVGSPGTWVEAAFGGDLIEGPNELITADRTVLPADNRIMLETDTVGSGVTPITATIDQAPFVLADDEGWQCTFKVGVNDDGVAVPMVAACTTSEMSIGSALGITNLTCSQIGGLVTVRYSYAGAKRGRFMVVWGQGTWTDNLGGVHVLSGYSPMAVVPCITSPRVITDADHDKILIAAAYVGGGFLFQLPLTATAGLTVTLSTFLNAGLDARVQTDASGTLVGAGIFSGAGVSDIKATAEGASITVKFVGGLANQWAVIGGLGEWTIVSGGVPTSDKYRFTPTVVSGTSGDVVVLDANGQIEDSGIALSSLSGSAAYVASLTAATVALVDDTDFTIVEAALNMTEGEGYILEVTPTTAVGLLSIILYQDAARLEAVYTMYVDLSDATTYRSPEVYGFQLETAGTLYATAFVSGVGVGETFDVALTAVGLAPGAPPAPLPSPYGQGIEDDGLGAPRIALASDSGLAFDINDKLVVLPDLTAAVYPTLTAAGVAIAGAVDTSTTQAVSAKKGFDAVGCIPQLTAGPPIAGDYVEGHEILDSDNVKWRCLTTGTPGTWELADSVYQTTAINSIGTLAPAGSAVVGITVKGNVGTIQRLQVWAVPSTGETLGEYSIPFRARVYETASELGRELVWQGNGFARCTYLSGALAAGLTAVPVNDNNVADIDEAIVLFVSDSRYELARIVARPTGEFTIDEPLVDASSWDADTYVAVASEWVNVPYVNNDADPGGQYQIVFQVRHDGLSTDPSMDFFALATIVSNGVVR